MDVKGILEKMRAEGAIPPASTGAITAENGGKFVNRQLHLALPGLPGRPGSRPEPESDSDDSDAEPPEQVGLCVACQVFCARLILGQMCVRGLLWFRLLCCHTRTDAYIVLC